MNDLRIGPQPEEERTQDFEHNGFRFKLKSLDPYGFIKITSLKDNKNLDGAYTSFVEARRGAIEHVIKVLEPKSK